MLVGLLLTGGKDKMQEMTKAMEKATDEISSNAQMEDGPPAELLKAAHRWSLASLDAFRGELLRKAMLLAAAISDFAHEYQNPS